MKKCIAVVSSLMLATMLLNMNSALGVERGDAAKGETVAVKCQPCHGKDGNHTAGQTIPKLAQQITEYLDKQLHDFKAGARKNSIMTGMAATLSAQDMLNVAAYFSSRRITPDQSSTTNLVESGKKIYQGGVAATSVPACASCHGSQAAGLAPAYPRLAGQHAQYLMAQLQNFKSGVRANDANSVMQDIASKLTDGEMQAVAEYLSTVP